MKKWAVFVLCVLVAGMLFGCNANQVPATDSAGPATDSAAPVTDSAAPVTDSAAPASNWPERTIELICANSVGGGSDLMSRAVANGVNGLGKLGQEIVVVNMTGSNGLIGAHYVASRPEDQYILLTQNGGEWGNWLLAPEYGVTKESFKPVAMVGWDSFCLSVLSTSDFNTMEDIIEYSKQNPGKVVFGGSSSGTSVDAILFQMMVDEAGLDAEYVPFDGGNDVTTALLGGHITACWGNPGEIAPHVESGEVRFLAMGSETRHPDYPDVPTTVEQGYPGIVFSIYRGVLAPADMPDENIEKLAALIEEAWNTEDFQTNYIKAKGMSPQFCGPEEFSKYLDQYEAIYEEIIAKLPAE